MNASGNNTLNGVIILIYLQIFFLLSDTSIVELHTEKTNISTYQKVVVLGKRTTRACTADSSEQTFQLYHFSKTEDSTRRLEKENVVL